MLCWAAKWYKSRAIMFDSVEKSGKRGTIQSIWDLLCEADIVIHYNGKRFDMPTLNREFLLYDMQPPTPYKQIDLFQTVKTKFRFVSNKLAHITKQLGFPGKIKTSHQLWLDCMNNKREAWDKMERYNKRDITELEKVYKRLLPWISDHPNMGSWIGDPQKRICANCGSDKVHSRGTQIAKFLRYKRFQCQACGTWMRERTAEKPRTLYRNVLTHVKS